RRALIIGVFALLCLPEIAPGQSFFAMRRQRTIIASFGTGTASYFGELKNDGDYIDARPSLNLGLQVFLSHRISARAEITWFQLAGTDAKANDDRQERNLSFRANNYEMNVAGLINLTPHGRRYYQRPNLNLYAFAGIGLIYSNPKAEYQGEYVALQPLKTEGVSYSTFQPVIPFGLGLRIKSGPYFNVAIEGGYRMTFTDYLDDVSIRRYPDPASLSSDLSRALSDRRRELDPDYPVNPGTGVRGNPTANDGYFLLNVKLEFYLPSEFFLGSSGQQKMLRSKKRAFYRYNKRGGLRK
ncbi:MAG: outer membrane beta-barrel protein, partial [Cyclobacteriaceae bacterium]|nr:outer membrane beta-barrel protein [Cyclobacteriaceae bacterium]